MKASIEDLWLNDTATTAVKRALNGARDPKRAKVPESMRKANYGIGARWQVGWIVDRKRRRKSFRDRRKAEEFAAMLEDDIRSGRYVDPADMARTVGQAGEEAFPLLVPVIKDATWNRYRRDWDNHVAPYWGELPLSALTPAALGAWIAALSDGSAASCHGIALSASSVKGIHRALSVAVGYAVENGWLPSDPLKRVTWPKIGRDAEPRVYLTIAQVETLARAAGEHGLEIRFLTYTGLRIGEALALRVADVDLRHRRVNVARTKTVSRTGHREVVGPPKNGRARKVPIVAPLAEPLADLCRGRRRAAVHGSARRLLVGVELAFARVEARVEGGGIGPHRRPGRAFAAAHVRVDRGRRRGGREDVAEGHGAQFRVDYARRVRGSVAGLVG